MFRALFFWTRAFEPRKSHLFDLQTTRLAIKKVIIAAAIEIKVLIGVNEQCAL
jgi:hypothetical protein